MKRRLSTLILGASLLGSVATAQTVTTTGSPSSGYVPVFTGGTTIGNSGIWQSTSGTNIGSIGIGTQNPQALLDVELSTDSTGSSPTMGLNVYNTITAGSPTDYPQNHLQSSYTGSTTQSFLYGLAASAIQSGAGTLTNAYGGLFKVQNTSTSNGPITYGYAILASGPAGTGTVTNAYGVYVSSQKQSGVTNAYGIYQKGSSDLNYFAGNVGLGTATPSAVLDAAGTQTNGNPGAGDYFLNYALGADLEDPNTGDIVLLVPAYVGTAVNASQFVGVIESNRGAVGGWNLNSQWYVSVQSAYTTNTGSILPLSGTQEYSAIPVLITCVYNGTTYIGFQTPSGNSLSQWSLTGNWINGQSSQKPIIVSQSSVSQISTIVGYESVGSQISETGLGTGGNVGIGTTTPSQKLEVKGNAQVDGVLTGTSGGSVQVGSSGILFPGSSTAQTTPWTGTVCGGDYAESVNVTGDRTKFEPGDVLVIDPDSPGKFLKSAEPYSTAVTGVYSTKPGVIGRRQATPASSDEVPMAMIGIVPTNVSAENGPIRPGDLLVSSSTIGYAMKGTDRSRMMGAIVGKALGTLDDGTGVIEVAVTLQ